MTTLIAWTSRDQDNFAALHVASDSRISWGSAQRWDAGRKIFGSRSGPDIWAYSGDVLFPALVLSQIMSAADSGLMFDRATPTEERHAVVFEAIKSSFERRHNAPDHDFTIIHAGRDGEKTAAQPRLWRISFKKKPKTWNNDEIALEQETQIAFANGTGANAFMKQAVRWKNSYVGGTSRAIYSAFCDAIASGTDPLSGGAPQIASIYPQGPASTAGVLYEGKLHLHGLPLQSAQRQDNIEWFDSLFQRIDPTTLKVRFGARRHARPKTLL